MKIFDKAAWQIDGGVSFNDVKRHFELVIKWLEKRNLLSSDGREISDIGVDESFSLNESMVTGEGADFLEQYYDELIKRSQYDTSVEEKLLTDFYLQFKKNKGL